MQNSIIVACLCNKADRFECYLVWNPKGQVFSRRLTEYVQKNIDSSFSGAPQP